MYLTCPNCQTVYTVRAAMLREGQGEVRCGACRTLFNALDYLSDELPDAEIPQAPQAAEAPVPAQETPIEPPASPLARPPAADSPAERSASMEARRDDLPAALSEDWRGLQHDRGAPRRNVALGALALALLLGLAGQYLWFEPRDLVARFPQTTEAVERFCRITGCLSPTRKDASRIQMLSRDVRAHPRYEGALLVSATFSNAAPWPQPMPRLRLQLYDVSGQTIASRVFTPREYLAESLPADSMLQPAQPLQVALEVIAPEEAAVSFEFSFL